MKITEDFIRQFASNSSALNNGKKLAAGGNYTGLHQSEDGDLLFGSCKGSGQTPYACSVDFADPAQPLPRCGCPSRQVPCKHAVGLLYCYLEQKKNFTIQDVPQNLVAKRKKRKETQEKNDTIKKEASPTSPISPAMTKTKAAAAVKKAKTQLEGIGMAEKFIHNILLSGLHSLNKKNAQTLAGQVKELGNYYIGGIQAAFADLLLTMGEGATRQNYTQAIEQVNAMHALLKASRRYLEAKIQDPDSAKDQMLHSRIEEQIGAAWKLTELKALGLCRQNEELLQLSFNRYEDNAKKQWVDEGVWISLTDGNIFRTYSYRPYKARKFIREEDSFFSILTVEELYVYPGDKNPRIRWEHCGQRDVTPKDLAAAQAFAQEDYASVIKQVRAQIKNPLADKNPIYPLKIHNLKINENGELAIEDKNGRLQLLRLDQFGSLLRKLSKEQVKDKTLAVLFDQDMREGVLYAVPLALVNDEAVIRFFY